MSPDERQEIPSELLEASETTERWPQYSWRPWNGFWFAPTVVAIYFILPAIGKTVPDVPQLVWFGWLAILGVATMGRNQEKIIKAGGSPDGALASAIKAIRG